VKGGQHLPKAYGTKVGGCYGEHVGEHIGNLQKHNGNLMGTHWEQGQMKKKTFLLPHLPQTLKEKKTRHFECMLGPSH
jgi:hypothetical protein